MNSKIRDNIYRAFVGEAEFCFRLMACGYVSDGRLPEKDSVYGVPSSKFRKVD